MSLVALWPRGKRGMLEKGAKGDWNVARSRQLCAQPPPRGSVPRLTFAYLSCPYLIPYGRLPAPLLPDRSVIAPMCKVTNLPNWGGRKVKANTISRLFIWGFYFIFILCPCWE